MGVIAVPNETKLDLQSPEAGRVALKGFFAIAEKWELGAAEQMVLLGGLPKSTFHAYRKLAPVSLSRDLMERISQVIGIYKALRILLQNEEHANAWVKRANTDHPFNGQSALDRMLAGSLVDLAVVREYLDAQRGC